MAVCDPGMSNMVHTNETKVGRRQSPGRTSRSGSHGSHNSNSSNRRHNDDHEDSDEILSNGTNSSTDETTGSESSNANANAAVAAGVSTTVLHAMKETVNGTTVGVSGGGGTSIINDSGGGGVNGGKEQDDDDSDPHIDLDEGVSLELMKEEEHLLAVEENEKDAAHSCNNRNQLESQMLAVAIMNSVVDTTSTTTSTVTAATAGATQADVNIKVEDCEQKMGPTSLTTINGNTKTATSNQNKITSNAIKVENSQIKQNGTTKSNVSKSKSKSNGKKNGNVNNNKGTSKKSTKAASSAKGTNGKGKGVYCGTRKRRRGTVPNYMTPPNGGELVTSSKGGTHNTRSSRMNIISTSPPPTPIINNLHSMPMLSGNNSVPNPILASQSYEEKRDGINYRPSNVTATSNTSTSNITSPVNAATNQIVQSAIDTTIAESKNLTNSTTNHGLIPMSIPILNPEIPTIKTELVENNIGTIPTTTTITTNDVSSQHNPTTKPLSPKHDSLQVSCPVKAEEGIPLPTTSTPSLPHLTITTLPNATKSSSKANNGNNSIVSFALQDLNGSSSSSNNNNESKTTRKRMFSIDFDHGFDFDSGMGAFPEFPNANTRENGSDAGAGSGGGSVRRDRGMSFELFSFGFPADEAATNNNSSSYDDAFNSAGRPRGDSIIFDPVSFTDGGIHEETALSRSRRNSLVLEENDEIELMNTPGFVEGPSTQSRSSGQSRNTQTRSVVANPVTAQSNSRSQRNKSSGRGSKSNSKASTKKHQMAHESRTRNPPSVYSNSKTHVTHTVTSGSGGLPPSNENTIHMPQGSAAAAAAASLPQILPSSLNGTVSHTSCPMELLNKGGRIGIYLPDARKERIAKFHSKRKMRIWRKRIKYDCRKKLADSRPRIKGRFVKSLDD